MPILLGRKGAVMKRYGFERQHMAEHNDVIDRYIPFLQGRPQRVAAINSDDVVNLVIALNTSRNFEEFLDKV